jgi:hypothetical protein
MCELISGVVELETGRVLFNFINSHSGIEQKHGLKPDTYREFEWTGEDRGYIRVRGCVEGERETVLAAIPWETRAAMVAAHRADWLKTPGNALQLGYIEGPRDDTRAQAMRDGYAGYLARVDKLTSVVIPAGVTTINDCAFQGCAGLTSVVIPAGVTTINDCAFQGCAGLTSVVIPAGMTTIGHYAFEGCAGLTSVVIPAGVTTIGYCAFAGCAGLTSVVIPAGMTTIGHYAFAGCAGLTSVVIPAGVTTIHDRAFAGCVKIIRK